MRHTRLGPSVGFFCFLASREAEKSSFEMAKKQNCAPFLFYMQDLETKRGRLDEVDLDMVPMSAELEEEDDDLAEYTFPKFAATYFQGSSTYTHIRKPLRHPLLYHEEKDDILVSCSFCATFLLCWLP